MRDRTVDPSYLGNAMRKKANKNINISPEPMYHLNMYVLSQNPTYIEIITSVSLGIGSIIYWEYKLYYASL